MGDDAEVIEGTGDARSIAQFAPDGQTFCIERGCVRVVTLATSKRRRAEKRAGAVGVGDRRRGCENAFKPGTAFAQVAANFPKTDQRAGEVLRAGAGLMLDHPRERGSDVVILRFQALKPGA